MSRHIDADALEKILAYWIEEKGYARKKHSEEFVKGMEDAYRRVLCFVKMEPKAEVFANNATADVVEVVRCKDCKFYNEAERMCNDTNGFDRYWKPTDFCSYGERRTDDDRNG